MSTLVTGAGGLIGARMLQPGDRPLIRGTDTFPGAGVGDLLDAASLTRAGEAIERVFH